MNGTDSRMPRTTISRGNFGQTRLILIGTAVLLSLGMGIRQSLGLFLTPVTRDLALTAADFTLAVAVQNIVWGPVASSGRRDRRPLRPPRHDGGGDRELRRLPLP